MATNEGAQPPSRHRGPRPPDPAQQAAARQQQHLEAQQRAARAALKGHRGPQGPPGGMHQQHRPRGPQGPPNVVFVPVVLANQRRHEPRLMRLSDIRDARARGVPYVRRNPKAGEESIIPTWVIFVMLIGLILTFVGGGAAEVVHHKKETKKKEQAVKVRKLQAKRAAAALSPSELNIARIIIEVGAETGRKAGLTPKQIRRAQQIGIATGLGESHLRNIDYGDSYGPDSRGVFQQRKGWGTYAQRTNPREAAKLFFTVNKGPGVRGLFHTKGWDKMSVTKAAHEVQRNRYPNAYAKFADMAWELVLQANGMRS